MTKRIVTFCSLLFLLWAPAPLAHAQKDKKNPEAGAEEESKDSLNKRDKNNKKQGQWFFRHEARMGEKAYAEFGDYVDDRKTGLWYKVDRNGDLMAIEHFDKDVLNGKAQYYDQGRLACIGNYRGLNPDVKFDSVWIVDINTYEEKLVAVPSERGQTKHGIWRYYDPVTGHMSREEEYQVDELIFRKDYPQEQVLDSAVVKRRSKFWTEKGKTEKGKRGAKTYGY